MRSLSLAVGVGVLASGCMAIPDGTNRLVAADYDSSASCGTGSAQARAAAEQPAASECAGFADYQQTYQATRSVMISERQLAETRSRIYWLDFRIDKAADAINKTERRLVASPDEATRDALNSQLLALREKHGELSVDLERLGLREQSQFDQWQSLASAADNAR